MIKFDVVPDSPRGMYEVQQFILGQIFRGVLTGVRKRQMKAKQETEFKENKKWKYMEQ